ncbi:hypothetical protein [Actinoplanes couchii]|uniref:Uncharacterized protein n=1 Tax=Actinoplanes couchii TaxID=403638 RepID=A0ABQ3XMA8_9ACTN|nr:hypothetical protein [Actinoplanes couchii]MDR6319233.1 hypothetical protein [Actinoplanes couchii]GID59557.1 hypothetical protein Aco03nite_079610 [Actinoplanes couchii]
MKYLLKRQTAGWGLFVGIVAEPEHTARGEQVTDRLWLDTSPLVDGFRGGPLQLSPEETGFLHAGLTRVAAGIRHASGDTDVTVVVRELLTVEVDYSPGGLAPAIAGWAAQQFGFPPDPEAWQIDARWQVTLA